MIYKLAPFPDSKFEIVSQVDTGQTAAVEWNWQATNSAPFLPGLEPSGRRLHLRGVDWFEMDGEGFLRVRRYFDQRAKAEQLGLQVLVEPRSQGRAVFGYSMCASSDNPNVPGIVALTWIRGRDDSEKNRIRFHSRKIIADFLALLLGRATCLTLIESSCQVRQSKKQPDSPVSGAG